MEQKKTVLVLFGGASSEHEISRISAASILKHINRDRYSIYTAGITKGGDWILTEADPERISDGSWEREEGNLPLSLSLNRSAGGFIACGPEGEKRIVPDVVFPVLHGRNGEDGTVQGMLQLAGMPFVGSDAESSAACMDKAVTKALVEQAEAAAQAKCCVIHRNGCDPEEAAEAAGVFFRGRMPLFVKPARAGSSVGITKVTEQEALPSAIRTAFAEDSKILVEEGITGRELEVAVLGNDDPQASCIGEIFSAGEFYDYDAKYNNADSRTGIVTDLPAEKQEEIRETAVRIYRVLECRGLARVDFFLQQDGTVIFNEINTIPGFTQISMYPLLWDASGLSYGELIDRLLEAAQ